ncbi:cystathionine gamma-synthase [Corynebacterium sp. 335C]
MTDHDHHGAPIGDVGARTVNSGAASTNIGGAPRPDRRPGTAAVRAGYEPDDHVGAINAPICMSSTFVQNGLGDLRGGFEYSRCANPTVAALEAVIAEMEGAALDAIPYCRVFASGMAATDALLRAVLRPGDHIVLPDDVYGGTYRLVSSTFAQWGIEWSVADIADADAVAAAIRPTTKLVWIETPTNPLLTIADIAAVADAVHAAGALLAVDNTFASPYLQRPLELGADVVVHSTTKYLGGHSDVIGGAVVTADEEIDRGVDGLRTGAGAAASPFDSYLAARGVKTLGVRMDRHCANAAAVAKHLQEHPAIAEVLYPGLETHRNHDVAARQMRGFGGMVSARLAGGPEAAKTLCLSTREFTLAESLGGVESLIEVPAAMTHLANTGTQVEVPADLVRISVGIEDVEDLLADLDRALDIAGK